MGASKVHDNHVVIADPVNGTSAVAAVICLFGHHCQEHHPAIVMLFLHTCDSLELVPQLVLFQCQLPLQPKEVAAALIPKAHEG